MEPNRTSNTELLTFWEFFSWWRRCVRRVELPPFVFKLIALADLLTLFKAVCIFIRKLPKFSFTKSGTKKETNSGTFQS